MLKIRLYNYLINLLILIKDYLERLYLIGIKSLLKRSRSRYLNYLR